MGIFHNPLKIMKLNATPFNSLWGIQTAQKDATEGFRCNIKALGCF